MLTESNEGHDEDLGALSQEHRQQHSLSGRTEDIAVHLLPARLLLRVLLWRDADSKSETATTWEVLMYR